MKYPNKVVTIGTIGSPVKLIDRKLSKVKQILVSYGGGMGGANLTYHGTISKVYTDLGGIKMVTINDVIKGEIKINPRFIVSTNDVTLIHEKWDDTARNNYNNVVCKESTVDRLLVVGGGTEIKFIEKYETNDDYKTINTIYNRIN